MPFQLSSIDNQVNEEALIELIRDPNPVSGFIGDATRVPIQFPPHVIDDTKSANWTEEPIATFEPLAIWTGSLPRKISVELTYIVTGKSFSTLSIPIICQNFKAYFYRSIQSTTIPIVKMKIYNHMTSPGSTWRLLDVGISHGETIINDGSGTFPLLTKIKFGAALVTNIDGKMKLQNLPKKPLSSWY
jgi:hypothetical protein